MLNTGNFSRTANQNHNEIILYLSEWLSSKYIQITNGKDVGEKGTFLPCWWECKFVNPLWKTVWNFRKLKIKLLLDPENSLLGIYLDKTKIQKDTCTPMFIAALFTIAET